MDTLRNFFSLRNSLFLGFLAAVNLLLASLVLFRGSEIHMENNLIENLQAGVLILACVIFAAAAVRLKGSHRLVAAFFSILSFIFFFRELDVEKFNVPQAVIFLLAERGRTIFFAAAVAVMAVLVVKYYRHFLTHRRIYMRSDIFIFVAMSAFSLLVFSHMFDRGWFKFEHNTLYEELAELSAYYFLLVTAVISVTEFRKIDLATIPPAS